MRADSVFVRRLAADRGFNEATLEKALRLLDVLNEMARHPYLRSRLALKGGTALNLFHWDVPRLSVDIDLNYIGAVALDQMQEERPVVVQAVNGIARAEGYRVQSGKSAHALETFLLWYRSLSGAQDHVEVEINFLLRQCLFDPEVRRTTLAEPSVGTEFPVLVIEELMAGKLVALLDRVAPRDLYDAYRFVLSGESYDETRLRQAFVFLATVGLPRPPWEYGPSRLSALTPDALERTLYPVLAAGERPKLEVMAETVTPLLAGLVDLQPAERQFADSVLSGEPQPGLLFTGDAACSDRLAVNPALLWKVQNVKRYLERGG